MQLTPRQVDVICAIRNTRHLHGYPPTIRELASQLALSRVTIVQHVEALIRKGYVRKAPKLARTLEIIADHAEPVPEAA